MHSPDAFRAVFAQAKPFAAYLQTCKVSERPNWDKVYAQVHLTADQQGVLRSFQRRVNALVISGTWCGDCVQQCPIFARFAEAFPAQGQSDTPGVDVRFIDRDEHAAFVAPFKICSGQRVPTVLWLNEDFDFISMLGDRTISRYRAMAKAQLGPSCPMPGAALPADQLTATINDWLAEFERVALICRLSGKLRQKHGD